MDVLKVFSHNVRMYRIRLGLSQEAVAVRTGLHRTYISAVSYDISYVLTYKLRIVIFFISESASGVDVNPSNYC